MVVGLPVRCRRRGRHSAHWVASRAQAIVFIITEMPNCAVAELLKALEPLSEDDVFLGYEVDDEELAIFSSRVPRLTSIQPGKMSIRL
jgi:bifunctional pyridoxal-dependent enzyme with beta-cystathionase and maltose regulon repressor activities